MDLFPPAQPFAGSWGGNPRLLSTAVWDAAALWRSSQIVGFGSDHLIRKIHRPALGRRSSGFCDGKAASTKRSLIVSPSGDDGGDHDHENGNDDDNDGHGHTDDDYDVRGNMSRGKVMHASAVMDFVSRV